ncbi:hypothetical protein CAEBREN_23038 [Caenorhabditis brenneri]|uniref:Methyltransferase FkbM domain-containing protein n=1 Tax=Caenorhabditis brenneri TaxID=135651 RepID=G0MR65_CAEBE|nr:hypothetical protein CAEBREN_23038 [Caenorhabditis brenneri]
MSANSGFWPVFLLLLILFIGISNYFTLNRIAAQQAVIEVPQLKPFPQPEAKQEILPPKNTPAPPAPAPIYSDIAKKLRKEALLRVQSDRDGILKAANGTRADKDKQNSRTEKSYDNMGGQIFIGTIPKDLTIPEMILKAGRNEVELLKIDIEGGETTALEPLIKDYYVCQIMIELHGQKPIEHLDMLRMMAKYGFRIFNVEPNPFCEKCCEYSLINELCMAQYGVVPLGVTIPH